MVYILAAGNGPNFFDPISQWLNFGVLGLLVFGMIFGFIWVKPGVDNIKEERDAQKARAEKAEEQRDHAIDIAQDKILPLLASFTASTSALLPLLQELVAQRSQERN